jgi:transposase-like protein
MDMVPTEFASGYRFPHGLTIHTDACKGLETAVDYVFYGVEHRECIRHFATNLGKSFKGKLIDDNLWPASLTYSLRKHNYHVNQLYTNSRLKIYTESHHKYLWARSKFGEGARWTM